MSNRDLEVHGKGRVSNVIWSTSSSRGSLWKSSAWERILSNDSASSLACYSSTMQGYKKSCLSQFCTSMTKRNWSGKRNVLDSLVLQIVWTLECKQRFFVHAFLLYVSEFEELYILTAGRSTQPRRCKRRTRGRKRRRSCTGTPGRTCRRRSPGDTFLRRWGRATRACKCSCRTAGRTWPRSGKGTSSGIPGPTFRPRKL